jgi:hypothetical protein
MVQAFRRSNYVSAAERDETPLDDVYFRLNVIDAKAKVGLDAWKEMGSLMELAKAYMDSDPIAQLSKKAIAKVLVRSDTEVPPRRHMKGPPPEDYVDLWKPKFLFVLPGPSPEYHEARCQLDTGTDKNFVAADFIHRWKIPETRLRPASRVVFQKNHTGNTIHPSSAVTLTFSLGSRGDTFRSKFLVVDGLAVDVLIGTEFIKNNLVNMPML